MNLSKSNKNVLRKSVLLLLVTAVPALAWAGPQDAKKTSAPAPKTSAPTKPAVKPSVPAPHASAPAQHASTPAHASLGGHTPMPKPKPTPTPTPKPKPTPTPTPRPKPTPKPTPRPGPTPGPGPKPVTTTRPGRDLPISGGKAHLRPDGQISTVDKNGMHIEHNLHGGRTIVSERNGVRTVTTGRHGGYVQRPYVDRGGHHYYQRTYCDHGVCRVGVYRGYSWGGRPYYGYHPAYWYNPGFYGWGYRPWGAPVYWGIGAWGWGGAPWYGFYGGYFAPYPSYASPAYWLTDYLIASNLQAAYAAQAEANADAQTNNPGGGAPPQAASNAVTLTPEVKEAIAEEVKAQLAVEQAAAGQSGQGASSGVTPTTSKEEVPPALDPARRTFVVSTDLAVVTSDGQECSLAQGDAIMRMTDTPDQDQKVNVSVSASKKSDCAPGKLVAVSVDDLQEMRNHFQEQLDEGMKTLASKQGTGGMPKAPDTGTTASDVPPPTQDNTAAKALQDQQQSADQTEDEVKTQASAASAGGQL
jgi:hypothetical protein